MASSPQDPQILSRFHQENSRKLNQSVDYTLKSTLNSPPPLQLRRNQIQIVLSPPPTNGVQSTSNAKIIYNQTNKVKIAKVAVLPQQHLNKRSGRNESKMGDLRLSHDVAAQRQQSRSILYIYILQNYSLVHSDSKSSTFDMSLLKPKRPAIDQLIQTLCKIPQKQSLIEALDQSRILPQLTSPVNRSFDRGGGVLLKAQLARHSLERDEQVLSNRIKMLQQEEERMTLYLMLKKIEETRVQAERIQHVSQRNHQKNQAKQQLRRSLESRLDIQREEIRNKIFLHGNPWD